MHTTNIKVVRGHSYEISTHENLSYESLLTQKFQIYGILVNHNHQPHFNKSYTHVLHKQGGGYLLL